MRGWLWIVQPGHGVHGRGGGIEGVDDGLRVGALGRQVGGVDQGVAGQVDRGGVGVPGGEGGLALAGGFHDAVAGAERSPVVDAAGDGRRGLLQVAEGVGVGDRRAAEQQRDDKRQAAHTAASFFFLVFNQRRRPPLRQRVWRRRRVTPPRWPAPPRPGPRRPAGRAAVLLGEGRGVVVAGEAFPVLQHLAVAEAGGAERGGGVLAERGGEGQQHGFLAFVAEAGLAGEGAAAQGGPLVDLLVIVGAVAQREQGAIEGVAVEFEQAGLFDQGAGLDQAAGARLAFVELDLGFCLGQAGLLLFMRAQALCKRTSHPSPLPSLWDGMVERPWRKRQSFTTINPHLDYAGSEMRLEGALALAQNSASSRPNPRTLSSMPQVRSACQ